MSDPHRPAALAVLVVRLFLPTPGNPKNINTVYSIKAKTFSTRNGLGMVLVEGAPLLTTIVATKTGVKAAVIEPNVRDKATWKVFPLGSFNITIQGPVISRNTMTFNVMKYTE